ncbi:adenylate kinase family enzyme [Dysgonomonas sp. PFB1-18]|uniref:hypothetical protein n=1 Tax=unclassified Dysgonomonas TaxID=2630389 RepID=UPI0024759C20|nr:MULTISPECIES: hypothetical protein [unclassified Dysgonomonas]MDH6307331.1 adenylate kinase family enzyme [Dysgonomonas sp. PF1-14]MDH6337249.1 adenylate kinase family enzyme [Dysgonomonas sp. PF1-16]MDH6379173.1 adenylate kinase family enzyme [Dysgonomonas sp. PFB1-18]MDH6396189.1 adenylate kinase family enzyme [Dysgonomonas sp. PF1-23]
MNKVIIIGNCGAGKTTFAIQIARKIGLPLIHLDKEYYQPGWKRPEKDQWQKKVTELVSEPKWILDGNYISSLDIRLKEADTIIFLDINRWICILSVLKRIMQGNIRDDMALGCKERFDTKFLKYVWSYNKQIRPRVYDLLNEYRETDLIILNSRKEMREYIDHFPKND